MAFITTRCVRIAGVLAALFILLPVTQASAEDRWVTDRGEFTMRSGKSTSNKIVRMLKSGTQVEVLKVDEAAGYSKVRTPDGKEGWVLNRYLLKSPPALVRLPQLEKDLGRVAELSDERQALQREVRQLTAENEKLSKELERIRKVSASAVQLDSENTRLKQALSTTEAMVVQLEDDNRRLGSRASREWFVAGAIVIIIGILLGLIIPRLQFRKKSSW